MASTLLQYDIAPRNKQFNFENTPKAWLNNNIYLSHMFDTSSIVIPYVEGLVNYSVKNSLDKIKDERLYEACLNLITQETFHAREHIKCNKILNSHGYHFSSFVDAFKQKLTRIKTNWSTLSVLGICVGFECFTAIISDIVIKEKILAQPQVEMQQFWQWHMIEELEHRAVLMDLYHHLGGRYFRRVITLAFVLWCYCFYGIKIYLGFLRADQASFLQGIKCIFNGSFFLRALFKTWRCFSYSFHPNEIG